MSRPIQGTTGGGTVADPHKIPGETAFLGKVDGRTGKTYPLAHHHEDAESVALELASKHPLVHVLAKSWNASLLDLQDLLAFLAGIHDVGKHSDKHGYQQKCRAWLAGEWPHARMHHTAAVQALLVADQNNLTTLREVENLRAVLRFLAAATGHLGRHATRLCHVEIRTQNMLKGRLC